MRSVHLANRTVFKLRLKLLLQCDVSRRLSGNEFQAIGPLTEKARRPNVFCQYSQEVTTGRSQMLSTGDVRDWNAAVDQVPRCLILKTPVHELSLPACTALQGH